MIIPKDFINESIEEGKKIDASEVVIFTDEYHGYLESEKGQIFFHREYVTENNVNQVVREGIESGYHLEKVLYLKRNR